MDRLTTRFSNGTAGLMIKTSQRVAHAKAIDRLAAYEDTGLEPEDIKAMYETVSNVSTPLWKIKELSDADKDDRLIVLPCKVGDTVWRIVGPKGHKIVRPRKLLAVTVYYTGEMVIHTDGADNTLGVSVFLTREEAEAALGGMMYECIG